MDSEETKEVIYEVQDPILFYSNRKEFGEFSNFYASEIEIDGLKYPTTEHYFQALKFYPDEESMEKVRLATSPGQAAKKGRDRKMPLRKDWEEVKLDVMYTALTGKQS